MDPASQRTTLPHFSTTQEFAGIARLSLVKALLVICIYIYINRIHLCIPPKEIRSLCTKKDLEISKKTKQYTCIVQFYSANQTQTSRLSQSKALQSRCLILALAGIHESPSFPRADHVEGITWIPLLDNHLAFWPTCNIAMDHVSSTLMRTVYI